MDEPNTLRGQDLLNTTPPVDFLVPIRSTMTKQNLPAVIHRFIS